jgi:hypothetical protein
MWLLQAYAGRGGVLQTFKPIAPEVIPETSRQLFTGSVELSDVERFDGFLSHRCERLLSLSDTT